MLFLSIFDGFLCQKSDFLPFSMVFSLFSLDFSAKNPFFQVINLHFPSKAKLFVHRVGRVARAGRSGTAISLIANDELPYLTDLFMFLGKPINFASDSSEYKG